MTPEKYVERIGQLVGSGRDQEALDFSAQFEALVRSELSPEQRDAVGGMLEGAIMAVKLREVAKQRKGARTA